ncbi:hypothetical protein PMI07_006550 [Rhizobium sp. CF080]|uniref:hypothetical protein n=1 Tax=Rhizobium sp. (strain CF080) TaxID=1144310 RepID=UPI0003E7FC4F|nr:hypothetical protein [Rhizobium sp. CF080]EUB98236.1 hypothetical protein PMI07_006550 [Rhizobium sp. CF080]
MAIYVALRRLPLPEPGSTIVVLICDAGEKYLDTIYNDDWLNERHLLNAPAYGRIERMFDAYRASVQIASLACKPSATSLLASRNVAGQLRSESSGRG